MLRRGPAFSFLFRPGRLRSLNPQSSDHTEPLGSRTPFLPSPTPALRKPAGPATDGRQAGSGQLTSYGSHNGETESPPLVAISLEELMTPPGDTRRHVLFDPAICHSRASLP